MRDYDEISDEEWDRHSFKLSRALKKRKRDGEDIHENRNGRTLPQIESFAFNKAKADSTASSSVNDVDNNDDDFKNGSRNANSSRLRKFKSTETRTTSSSPIQNLEDDDFDFGRNKARGSRSRRLIVEDDSDDDHNRVKEDGTSCRTTLEVVDIDAESVQESPEESDVVGNALQKCYKISAALRHKLYGSSLLLSSINEGYSEVNDSAAKIVTQDDVTAACASEDSKFVPILKPYQLVGVNFLLLLHRNNIGGAILADEMGLGKTVQAITYLTLLKHLDNEPGPHLVVCPASVLENWERELQRWCPSFSILQYHGAGRAAYSKELNSLSKAGLPPPFDVLLVCYSLFERHSLQQKDDRKALKRWKWSCVLMDEAHVLKDRNSYRRKNLLQVAKHANQRLMLTGTPLQNDLHELWSLLEFMMPDIFETGDVDLKKLLNAEDKDLIARIKSILGPFVLRRLKKDVMQQLVPKEQRVECVTMGNEQDTAYRDSISEYRAASLARSTKTSESVKSTVGSLPRRQLSNYFTQFRKVANHPLLIRRIYSDKDVIHLAKELHPKGIFGFECTLDRVISELKSYSDFALHRLLVSYGGCASTRGPLQKRHILGSAKCQVLAELLPSLKRDGHRVLIFSQWTTMLDVLEAALDVIGVTYSRLDGSTQVTERQTIVDNFNNDSSIFACLLSTRAGGQGLNLTGADTVIIHDMDFNPQIDRQAEDRCHRIGQTRPVTVYRLVTKGTVDENIFAIAKRKLTLDAAVLESDVELENDNDTMEKTMAEILSSILMG